MRLMVVFNCLFRLMVVFSLLLRLRLVLRNLRIRILMLVDDDLRNLEMLRMTVQMVRMVRQGDGILTQSRGLVRGEEVTHPGDVGDERLGLADEDQEDTDSVTHSYVPCSLCEPSHTHEEKYRWVCVKCGRFLVQPHQCMLSGAWRVPLLYLDRRLYCWTKRDLQNEHWSSAYMLQSMW